MFFGSNYANMKESRFRPAAARGIRRQSQPHERRVELINEVESLRELRRISEMSQPKVAELLKISQRAVSKIEKQTNMYLYSARLCRSDGGELDIIGRLPNRRPVKLKSLEDVTSSLKGGIDTNRKGVRTATPLHISTFC